MFKAATIKDIAKALNFSPSTVSRALRDGYEISEETKKKVLEYAEKVNYRSNPIALSLKNRRTHSIGIVVPEVANSFFSQTIAGIESIAYEKGYHTIITQTHDSYEREKINVNHLANRSVDGLLISMSAETADYEYLKKLHSNGLPIVFFDRIINDIDTFKVTSDNFKAAYQTTELLLKNGCKTIAHLSNAHQLSITRERLAGYKAALKDHAIPFNDDLVRHCEKGGSDSEEVEKAVQHFLTLDQLPDAIFVASDRLSVLCLRAIKKYSFDANKLLIAGFSNSDIVDMLHPSLSYVKQKAFEMGQIAVEMLIRLIESKYPITEFETRVLETEIFWNNKGNS